MPRIRLGDGPALRVSRKLADALVAGSITRADCVAEARDDRFMPALVLVIGDQVVLASDEGVRCWKASDLAAVEDVHIIARDGTPLPISGWRHHEQAERLRAAVRDLLERPAIVEQPASPPPEPAAVQPAATPPRSPASGKERSAAAGVTFLVIAVLVVLFCWSQDIGPNGVILFAYAPWLIPFALAIVIGTPVFIAKHFPAGGSFRPLLGTLAACCAAGLGFVAIDAVQAHRKDDQLLQSTRTLAGLRSDNGGLHVAIRRHAGDGTVELVLRMEPPATETFQHFSAWNELFCETPRTQVVFANPNAATATASSAVLPYLRASLHTVDPGRPPEPAHCYFHTPKTLLVMLHRG